MISSSLRKRSRIAYNFSHAAFNLPDTIYDEVDSVFECLSMIQEWDESLSNFHFIWVLKLLEEER